MSDPRLGRLPVLARRRCDGAWIDLRYFCELMEGDELTPLGRGRTFAEIGRLKGVIAASDAKQAPRQL
jgi:hypothetical protein